MRFRYRYVRFGEVFSTATGVRPDANSRPEILYGNELAVDVGGVCWGVGGEARSVLDHHYEAAEFPSAAAAVLHQSGKIWSRFSPLLESGDEIWLVSHNQPDFDAFCAMYLARRILEAGDPGNQIPHDGWDKIGVFSDRWETLRSRERIDWFGPYPAKAISERDRLWPVQLAAYASCVDNGKQISCARQRALHSVLYAAMMRGRDYENETSGAAEFFREAENQISENRLNPRFDSVLENSQEFTSEFSLLDRELERYATDLRRGRRALVNVQRSTQDFHQWYRAIAEKQLVLQSQSGLIRNQEQFKPAGSLARQVDGIYLRDPECMLFKEWARLDRENSPSGEGFLFTAIAYSGERPSGAVNQSNYFFSLDPERAAAKGLHLYNVWASLQFAEIQSVQDRTDCKLLRQTLEQNEEKESKAGATACRTGFRGRAGKFAAFFDDPWFDGSNYRCTIVASPNRGTVIGTAGTNSDLSDDQIVDLVSRELELSFYAQQISIRDLSVLPDHPARREESCSIEAIVEIRPVDENQIRFVRIELNENVDPFHQGMGVQAGEILWRTLEPDGGGRVPADFLTRHLLINKDWIGVWNRRGAAIATKSAARAPDRLEELFGKFARLARIVERLSRAESTREGSLKVISRSEKVMRALPTLTRQLALAENRLAARYFEAARIGELLRMLHDFHAAAIERVERQEAQKRDADTARNIKTMAHIQTIVEWIEIFIVSVYAAELCANLSEPEPGKSSEYRTLYIAAAAAFGAIATAALVLPTPLKKCLVIAIAVFALMAIIPFVHPGDIHLGEFVQAFWQSMLRSPTRWLISSISLIVVLILVLILKTGKRRHDLH
jgi:hypothetical protein